MSESKGHAIILGGSISGLLAARILTNHFDRVTIVERDKLANDLAPRKAAPQGAHAHALLSRGRVIVEGLPDLEARRNNPKAQNWLIRFLLWYTERLQKTATRNVYVSRTLLRVQNMIEPPAKLFGPPVFFRVVFA